MENAPPEIWYLVCSYLAVDDLQNVRLVSKALADIGAAYMLPEVTFYMEDTELQRLHEISLHPVFSKHVRSLTYFGEALRDLSWREFLMDYKLEVQWDSKLKKRNLGQHQLLAEFKKYRRALATQDTIMSKSLDLQILREALPRFPQLRHLAMSAGGKFYEGPFHTKRNRGLDSVLTYDPEYAVFPEGVHPLTALLLASAEAKCSLRSLRAGFLHWKFFDKSPVDLIPMFKPLANLTSLDIAVCHSFDLADTPSDDGMDLDFILDCREIMAKGNMRRILKLMPQLHCLRIDVLYDECEGASKAALLQDVFEPGFRWPNLHELVIAGIESERDKLTDLLVLHKDTLRKLCLRNTTLIRGSWKKLLPDIREKLYLDDVCICDMLYGWIEDPEDINEDDALEDDDPGSEFWAFEEPIDGPNRMRDSVNMYCRSGGSRYPAELPLDEDTVRKHYNEYVEPFVDPAGLHIQDDEDNWEDVDEDEDEVDEDDHDEDEYSWYEENYGFPYDEDDEDDEDLMRVSAAARLAYDPSSTVWEMLGSAMDHLAAGNNQD